MYMVRFEKCTLTMKSRQRKKNNQSRVVGEILESQIETGTPYMLYKDAANNASQIKRI
jgi:ribonucleoside-diphosphate reductase alpha chain